MINTVLNVVRHQNGRPRLGIVGDEYKDATHKIVLKGFFGPGSGDLEFNPNKSYYNYGSLYSRELSDRLEQAGYARGPKDNIWLIKAHFEVGSKGEHVFTFVERCPRAKVMRHDCLIKGGQEFWYERGHLVEEVWNGKVMGEKLHEESLSDWRLLNLVSISL